MSPWACVPVYSTEPWQMTQVHLVPLFDELVHTASLGCQCKPHEDEFDHCVIHHNAVDGRDDAVGYMQ